jgi:hypothetical protein
MKEIISAPPPAGRENIKIPTPHKLERLFTFSPHPLKKKLIEVSLL